MSAIGRPQPEEAAAYYHNYIQQVPGDDPVAVLAAQLPEFDRFAAAISEDWSRHRYAPGKWSMREVLAHVTDTERVMAFRAFWFARGLPPDLPSFDQDAAVATAGSDQIAWAEHAEEFRRVRAASLDLFRHLSPEAWGRRGVASGNPVSVRALAFIVAGHYAHHLRLLRERYL